MITQDSIGHTGSHHLSLTGGDTIYNVVQIRTTSPGSIRVQWVGNEITFQVSTDLTTWLSTCKATRQSLAGTKAMYVPALARQEITTDQPGHWVRFQVPGPKLNREWGAVFVAYAPTMYKALGA